MRVIIGLLLIGLTGCAAKETSSDILAGCWSTKLFQSHMSAKYDEQPVWAALGADGLIYGMADSGRNGSWTVYRSTPSGVTCAVLSGSNSLLFENAAKERMEIPQSGT